VIVTGIEVASVKAMALSAQAAVSGMILTAFLVSKARA